MASRISTGFHRLGLILALPCMIVAAWLAFHEWRAAGGHLTWGNVSKPVVAAPPCHTDPWWECYKRAPAEFDPNAPFELVGEPRTADYTIALLLASCGVALYAAARALGWIISGFAGA